MTEAERHDWIRNWMLQGGEHAFADVLSDKLVRAYAEATGASVKAMNIGAPRCKQLGADLSAMYKKGKLYRHTSGLGQGDSSMGFPKWVYVYTLAP